MLVRCVVLGVPIFMVLFNLTASQSSSGDSASDQHRKRRISDPMSNFFSELGELFLDVDQTIAVQSQPKIEHETNIMSQLFRPQPDYFDRIQKNYRDMQKRLGSLIGNTIGFRNSYSDHELSTVNPPENFSPTIEPDYNPFAAAAEARKEKIKERISKASSRANVKNAEPKISLPKSIDESFKAFSKLSQAIIDDIGDFSRKPSKLDSAETPSADKRTGDLELQEECSNEIIEDPDLKRRKEERCSQIAAEKQIMEDLRKLLLQPKQSTEALFSKGIGRSGDVDLSERPEDSESREASDEASVECSDEVLEDVALEKIRKEKCDRIAAKERLIKYLSKLLKDPKRASMKLFPIDSVLKRSGDVVEDENLSDSSLDTQIRQLIKDHGSWILDYPLIKRWRQRDISKDNESEQNSKETEHSTLESASDMVEIEPTELYIPVTADYDMAFQKSGETAQEHPHQSSYYRIMNEDGDGVEEEVEFVLEPESLSDNIEAIEVERHEPKETIILAFTSDGVPLKLMLGPEVDNPIQYLHKALQSAGVSLNIPVESYEDLEPVGKEVLKLGSGILTRAVLINASNPNELKSLLKALMVSKSSGKTSF